MTNRRVMGATPTVTDGIRFQSKREAKRWAELQMLEKTRQISHLERQYPVVLEGQHGALLTPTGRPMKYVADFRYFDIRINAWVIEDAKGHPTDTYKMKRAVLAAMGVEVREV